MCCFGLTWNASPITRERCANFRHRLKMKHGEFIGPTCPTGRLSNNSKIADNSTRFSKNISRSNQERYENGVTKLLVVIKCGIRFIGVVIIFFNPCTF